MHATTNCVISLYNIETIIKSSIIEICLSIDITDGSIN